jgi:hypothetical protein
LCIGSGWFGIDSDLRAVVLSEAKTKLKNRSDSL